MGQFEEVVKYKIKTEQISKIKPCCPYAAMLKYRVQQKTKNTERKTYQISKPRERISINDLKHKSYYQKKVP